MLGNYLQQTTSADDIFRCFFLGALRFKLKTTKLSSHMTEAMLVLENGRTKIASIQYMSQMKRGYSVAILYSRAGLYSARATQWVLSYHYHIIVSFVERNLLLFCGIWTIV